MAITLKSKFFSTWKSGQPKIEDIDGCVVSKKKIPVRLLTIISQSSAIIE